MNRLLKYRKFRREVKKIARKFAAAECNPLGRDAIMNLFLYEKQYDKLNEKWQQWIGERVARAINAYHTPVVQCPNGEWYSAADMDDAMLRGW